MNASTMEKESSKEKDNYLKSRHDVSPNDGVEKSLEKKGVNRWSWKREEKQNEYLVQSIF